MGDIMKILRYDLVVGQRSYLHLFHHNEWTLFLLCQSMYSHCLILNVKKYLLLDSSNGYTIVIGQDSTVRQVILIARTVINIFAPSSFLECIYIYIYIYIYIWPPGQKSIFLHHTVSKQPCAHLRIPIACNILAVQFFREGGAAQEKKKKA